MGGYLLLGLASVGAPPQPVANGWRVLRPLPVPAIFAAYALGQDGRIYVFSGVTSKDAAGPTSVTRIFHPGTGEWSTGAPIPVPVTEAGAATGPDGRIFVIGGGLSGGPRRATGANQIYNPKTDTWSNGNSMPTARSALGVVAVAAHGQTLIYAIGGRDFKGVHAGLSAVEAYDPATDRWITKAPMPTYRHALTATLGPDGKIYAIGGANHELGYTNAVEVYDPRTNAWRVGTSLPNAVECAASVSTAGKRGQILVIGGWGVLDKVDLNTVRSFNPRSQRWGTLSAIPVANAAGGAIATTGLSGQTCIYVLGGTPTGTTNEVYTFGP